MPYFWRPSTTDKSVDYLVKPSECVGGVCTGEVILGGYSHEFKTYRPWVNGAWGEVAKSPIEPRDICKNFGITPNQPSAAYSRGGKEITAAEAQAAVLKDDSAQPYLTIIDKDFEKIVPTVNLPDVRVQGYPPGHWAVKSLEPLGGVVYQKADGTVLYKAPHFVGVDPILNSINAPETPALGLGVIAAIFLGFFLWRRHANAQ